jgi:hypothetical protein
VLKSEVKDGDEEVTVQFRDGQGQPIEKRLVTAYAKLERL